MVMEYMPGGELFTLLRKVGCFPEYVAVLYAAELVLAIEYLHNNNVIYRDLKLENIMMCAKGHLKLADLGIAKEGIGFGKKTYTFCGTYHYLAPEIVNDSGHGKAVDWWSLVLFSINQGALIFEMLVGRPAFMGESKSAIMKQITKVISNKNTLETHCNRRITV